MAKEINLQLSDSLFSALSEKANAQGVSIEALCLSILTKEDKLPGFTLVEPGLYSYMPHGDLRSEIQRVLQSNLPEAEAKRRVQSLKLQIARCIR